MKSASQYLKFLLFPFSLLYDGITTLRNRLYDKEVLSSIPFDIPLINIGNLSTGGTGKTPMVEYLVEAFYNSYRMAILSRGYRRKSRGFVLADAQSTATRIGDEPYQYYLKYPRVSVAVCEDRVIAVPMLLQQRPDTEVILLDDAYQHRAISPGINILLTRYDRPFTQDFILPTGSLRESRRGKSRADIIVVTKCPSDMAPKEVENWKEEIAPESHQSLYFSTLTYGQLYGLSDTTQTLAPDGYNVVAVTGLASDKSMLDYLHSVAQSVHPLSYSDHQNYNLQKIEEIKSAYENMPEPKIIVTTEKDAVKLIDNKDSLSQLPVYILPVKVSFLFNKGATFTQSLNQYIQKNINGQEQKEDTQIKV